MRADPARGNVASRANPLPKAAFKPRQRAGLPPNTDPRLKCPKGVSIGE